MTGDSTHDVAAGLADDLAALSSAPRHRPGPPCGMQTILAGLEEKAATSLQALIDDVQVSASSLSKVLSEHGLRVSPQSVARHRRRGLHNGCRCDR